MHLHADNTAFSARVARPTTGPAADSHSVAPPVRNLLLGSLPDEELEEVRQYIEVVHLEQRASLFKPDEPITHVWFPETAVVSFVNTFTDGTTVEVGTAGCEGMAGLALF